LKWFFTSERSAINVLVDFENAKPGSEHERQIYDIVSKVLEKCGMILDSVSKYVSCEEAIRAAMRNPQPETEEKAWLGVSAAVAQVKMIYEFAYEVAQCVPLLLMTLSQKGT